MTWANPGYLWCLLGLLLPLAIHLWSRKTGKVLKVGSVKFFSAGETTKARRIHLQELGLLLLRSLMIIALVLMLAGPRIDNPSPRETYVFVERDLLTDDSFTGVMDSLMNAGDIVVRVLEEGFPDPENDKENVSINSSEHNLWHLIRNIDYWGLDSAVVFSRSRVSTFRGQRPQTTTKLTWYTVPYQANTSYLIDAYEGKSGSTVGLILDTSSEKLEAKFQTLEGNAGIDVEFADDTANRRARLHGQEFWAPVRHVPALKAMFWVDQGFEKQAQYLQAAFMALGEYFDQGIYFNVEVSSNYKPLADGEVIVWLSTDSLPEVDPGAVLLTLKSDTFATALIKVVKPGRYELTSPITYENVVDDDLASQLAPLFYGPTYTTLDTLIDHLDKRVMPVVQLLPRNKSSESKAARQEAASLWLWVPFLVILFAERLISNYRKQ